MEVEKEKGEFPKQLEDRYKWLEEKFKALESVDYQCGMDAKKLSLVLDLMLPSKFKIPEFEKYNRTSYPEAHITMFSRRMTGQFDWGCGQMVQSAESYPSQIMEGLSTALREAIRSCDKYSI
ncbi:hypothetical protein PVK06_002298 [Gossypium arboreum]|uniref:Uncharacterized protein n=1 Tax=Gossypium arboreum TaxID=29729 RepID=A0ABR0R4D4_GOSAR|nr:hypothetical protein PVK06_002298 [Gossypium arboreum]